mgnify:CR=1 FL=1
MNYIELIILIVIIGIIIFIKNYSQKIIEHFGLFGKTFRKAKRGVKKTAKKVGRGVKKTAKKVGRGVKKTAKKVGKGIKKGFKKVTGGIGDAIDFIKSLPKKISEILSSIIDGMRDGITKGLNEAFDFVLTTIGKTLETIFGPIFTPLMPYFWAIGIGFGFLILTCIGSALYIYTRPSPQIGGFVKNNIELFNIIFILLLSIFIFSRQKIEHFGLLPSLESVLDPIKKTFNKIIEKVLEIIKKLLKTLKDNTIGRLEKMIKIVIVEIQEFLKPALIGFAILPIIGIIAVIGGTIFFYGSNDKPAQKPTPTPTPASAPKPVYIPVPIATPPTPTPVVFQGGKK